jgi:DNA repair photolyase
VRSSTCVYCFARKTHSYLGLDTGLGFDSQIVVKVNAPELLRRRLASRRWQGEHVAMGTNVACYQRAEGRRAGQPLLDLTKGTLIPRDLDLLTRAARVTDVGISVSVGFTDTELWRTVEPGTPAPERRLEVVRALGERGIGCGVLMAPVIPFLGDSPSQLRATVRAIAAAGATSVTPLALHLRPGAREWYMQWLAEHHPGLVRHYEALYADGAYAPRWYQRRITRQVHELAAEYGIGPSSPGGHRRIDVHPDRATGQDSGAEPENPGPEPGCQQLTLL